jgi:hypothetical protein
MSPAAVSWVFSAIGPCLVLVLCVQRLIGWRWPAFRGWPLLIVPGALALGMVLIPVDGIALARWVASVSASFSVPFLGLLAIAAWERAFARPLLERRDRQAAWAFGAVAGLVLYPFALGVGSVDPYEWGWYRSPLFVLVGLLTGWLIWTRNRFGILLLAAVVAFHLRLGESSNYWDYLVDPVYWFASLVVVGRKVVGVRSARRVRLQPDSDPST